jgi:hypothetical protein
MGYKSQKHGSNRPALLKKARADSSPKNFCIDDPFAGHSGSVTFLPAAQGMVMDAPSIANKFAACVNLPFPNKVIPLNFGFTKIHQ